MCVDIMGRVADTGVSVIASLRVSVRIRCTQAITKVAKLIPKAHHAISAMVSGTMCIMAFQFGARQFHYVETGD